MVVPRAARVLTASQLLPVVARRCATATNTVSDTSPDPSTNDPLGLTDAAVSKIYCAPSAEAKEVFPRGLPKNYTTQVDTFKKMCWILRAPTYEIISQLRDRGDDYSSNKYLIYGGDGCGKTLCLNQVVHWCWKAGWLVLHVPGVSFWAHSRKELRPSQRYPDTYDQPHEATIWLKNFRSVNSKVLKNIKLSEARSWTRKESSEVGENLGSVIERGLHKPVLATDVVGVVVEEVLREQARQSELESERGSKLKLLLAIDEFNGFFNPCAAHISKFEPIQSPEQLNLIRYFKDLIPMGKFPGAVVTSLSRRKTYKFFSPTTAPSDLLGTEGMEAIAGYKQLELDNFSREEVQNLLSYYKKNNWITKEPYERVYQEMWHLSEGNAAEVYKLSCMM